MDMKTLSERTSSLLHIPARFIYAWWVSENGWDFPTDNNPGNISYTGVGEPDPIGVFAGVVNVQANRVVTYKTQVDGVNAFVLLLELPLSSKELSITSEQLRLATTVEEQCRIVGNSNWASSHYQPTDPQGVPLPGSWKGEDIWNVYTSEAMDKIFGSLQETEKALTPNEEKIAPERVTPKRFYTVLKDDTLLKISRRFLIPEEVLKIFNPEPLKEGIEIVIPDKIRVEYGDTLDAISTKYGILLDTIRAANRIIDPNRIFRGQILFV